MAIRTLPLALAALALLAMGAALAMAVGREGVAGKHDIASFDPASSAPIPTLEEKLADLDALPRGGGGLPLPARVLPIAGFVKAAPITTAEPLTGAALAEALRIQEEKRAALAAPAFREPPAVVPVASAAPGTGLPLSWPVFRSGAILGRVVREHVVHAAVAPAPRPSGWRSAAKPQPVETILPGTPLRAKEPAPECARVVGPGRVRGSATPEGR